MNINSKPQWAVFGRDEQESIIRIDYYDKTLTFYTSRKSVAERLRKKVGEPTKTDIQNDLVTGVTYIRNLHDKDVKQFLSVSSIIGGFRNEYVSDDKLVKKD